MVDNLMISKNEEKLQNESKVVMLKPHRRNYVKPPAPNYVVHVR